MRFRQITSILTLPTRSALDKRGMELADIWIQVTSRGHARVHEIVVDDYSGQVKPRLVESLNFPDASYLPVKAAADEKKEKLVEGEEFSEEAGDTITAEDLRRERREERDEWIRKMYEKSDMSQRDLAEETDLSLSRINEIINSE